MTEPAPHNPDAAPRPGAESTQSGALRSPDSLDDALRAIAARGAQTSGLCLHDLDEALRLVEAGELQVLSPEQVARLEVLLNCDVRLAARIANQRPAPDRLLPAALPMLDEDERPSLAAWERVWERIDGAATSRRRPVVGMTLRVLRLWRPLAAAAACVLLVLGWRVTLAPAVEPWPLRLAADVEIDQLEVYQGATSFIVAVGDDNGGEIIWVLPEGT